MGSHGSEDDTNPSALGSPIHHLQRPDRGLHSPQGRGGQPEQRLRCPHGRLNFEGYIDSVKAYSQDITQLGVQWHFTEITVRTLDEGDSEFMTNEEQFQQAELYWGLMQVCIDLGPDTCITFQTWGHSDRYTNWEQIDGKKPFLFDYDNNPKVSYYSVVEALQNTETA